MLQAATPAGLTNSPRTGQDSTEQQQHHAATRPRHALHPPVPGRYGADPKLLPAPARLKFVDKYSHTHGRMQIAQLPKLANEHQN